MKSRWSGSAKEMVFDVFYGVFVSCRFDEYTLGRGILSMKMHWLEDSSLKIWFLAIILANIRRMEMKSRWSERTMEVAYDPFNGNFV